MRLTRAADHSGLWLVLAAAGASFAGKRGRRAPAQGVLLSASGFAFAVAASRELPEAGPVLLPLAARIAYSRVYSACITQPMSSLVPRSAQPSEWPTGRQCEDSGWT